MWSRLVGVSILVVLTACGGTADPASDSTVPPTDSTVPPTDSTDPPTMVLDDVAIETTLAAKRQSYPAPGAMAVVDVGGDRVGAWSGTADVDGTPISPLTRFRIASITKPLTAALVLDAVQRGELSLDDEVNDLVPGLLAAEGDVTVRMLLEHTAGIFDETNNPDILDDIALLTDEQEIAEANDLSARYLAGEAVTVPDRLLVSLAEAHGRAFPPGTAYSYSNMNFQVAAIVLESVTGTPIADLFRERMVEPLGLRSTTLAPPDLATPDFHGYATSVDDGSLVDITDDLVLFGNGASGGIVSTGDELLTMIQAIVSGDLLDEELRTEMRTPTKLSGGTYGLGLVTYELSCGTFYGHEGGVNGTASIAMTPLDGSSGVVVAFNLRDGSDPRLPALADDLLCPSVERAS